MDVPPAAMAPAPAKPRLVADVVMVSRDATPVTFPDVSTFNPPLETTANVPVPFPIVTLFVPVPSETAPEPLTVNAPEV